MDETQSTENKTEENPVADAPKKRGPKPGSKNIPKIGAVPVPRKRPDQITDTRQAAQRRLEETRAILERHDKEHGTKTADALPQWDDIQRGQATPPPPPQLTPEVIGMYLTIGFNLLGETLDVKSRPAPQSIGAAADAIANLSAYLPMMSPMQTAALSAGGALVMCAAPMVLEYRDIKAGRISPASMRDIRKATNETDI